MKFSYEDFDQVMKINVQLEQACIPSGYRLHWRKLKKAQFINLASTLD